MIQMHANEVRQCRGCLERVVFLKNTYGKWGVFNVRDTGQSWYTIDDTDRHDCKGKERLISLRRKPR